MRRIVSHFGERDGALNGFVLDKVIGHRGVPRRVAENSLEGLREAAQLGYTWCEIDAQASRDGVAFLRHDFDLGDAKEGCLRDYDAVELAQVVIGIDGETDSQITMPRLDDALVLASELGLGLVVEIKAQEQDAQRVAEVTANTMKEASGGKLMVSSFNDVALENFHSLMPDMPLALNTVGLPEQVADIYKNVHFDYNQADAAGVNLLKQLGHCLYAYTVNEAADRDRLLAMGVDGVFTDDPGLLVD